MHPLEHMEYLIAEAKNERNLMAATAIILLKKLDGSAVITKGEIEDAMTGKLEIRQEDETDIGFKLVVHEVENH